MKVNKLPGHSWGSEIKVNLTTCSDTDIKEIGIQASKNLVVLIRQQNLTERDQARICNIIGNTEKMPNEIHYRCPTDAKGNVYSEIQKVTGKKDHNGNPTGLFHHNDVLDWHANRASFTAGRKPLVWLYSVAGSEKSKTSWLNLELAYSQLPLTLKEKIRNLKAYYGYKPGKYTPNTDFKEHINSQSFPFIRKNQFSTKEGIYFPFNQIFGFEGLTESESNQLIDELKDHVINENFIYHHDWQDGDIIISEQWLTVHKRWPFDVSKRTLHRITMDYPTI